MTTELEKTQLEIAKLQLEQEKRKLAQLQKRQEVADGLGRGAAAVGGVAVKGGSAVLRYMGRWLLWAVVVEVLIFAVVGGIVTRSPSGHGLVWDVGARLGMMVGPHFITGVGAPTILAAIPPSWGDAPGDGIKSAAIWLAIGSLFLWRRFWI